MKEIADTKTVAHSPSFFGHRIYMFTITSVAFVRGNWKTNLIFVSLFCCCYYMYSLICLCNVSSIGFLSMDWTMVRKEPDLKKQMYEEESKKKRKFRLLPYASCVHIHFIRLHWNYSRPGQQFVSIKIHRKSDVSEN